MELSPGTKLNKYKINRTLGHGGFAFTYEAVNEPIGLRVCIKELDEFGADEGKVLNSVSCENVVRVLDYFEENGKNYLVLEYLDGQTLGQYVSEKGRIESDKLFSLSKQLIKALEQVHGKGLIHRDIAPDNIMIVSEKDNDIENARLKLFDFGTARRMGKENYTSVLKDGFTPIEQLAGEKNQGAYTDIYALCATLFYCLTGKKPESAYSRLLDDSLKKPSELGIAIDPRLEKILMKGLAVKSEDRYQSAKELLSDVEKVLPDKNSELTAIDVPKKKKSAKFKISLCCVMLLIVGILSAVMIKNYNQSYMRYDSETMYKITLTPSENFTVAGYNKSITILEERLKLFAKKSGKYTLEENGGTLTLLLNKSDFPQNETTDTDYKVTEATYDSIPEYILRAYLTRAVSLELESKNSDESIALDQTKDISVTLENSDESGTTLDVNFSEEFLKENKAVLDSFGNDYSLKQDSESSPPVTPYTTKPKEDGSGFYLLSDDSEALSELLLYNLTHEPLENSFNIWIEEQTTWQEDEAQFGEYQVKENEISDEKAVTAYTYGVMTDGELLDYYSVLRNRLDCLGTKYSLGEADPLSAVTSGCMANIYSFAAMKTTDTRLYNTDIINLLLLSKKFYLITENGEFSDDYILSSYSSYNSDKALSVNDYALSKKLSDKKEKVYLAYLNNYDQTYLMVGKYDEADDCFKFTNFANGDAVSEDNEWVMALIDLCINNQPPTDVVAYDIKAENEEDLKEIGLFEEK